ncbi:hypothetical protein L7F22_013033 [Adiantum nelumboides]|nr:hypothetical protein [Adiantum nelumboides]
MRWMVQRWTFLFKEPFWETHLRPSDPPSTSEIGIHLSSHTLRTIHESTVSLEACSLACKVVGSLCSARLLKDYFQVSLLHVNFKIVNVSPLGRGFLAKWTHGMDLNGLEGGTTVTTRFPGLLSKFAPHVNEIGRCMGFVVGDAVIPDDEDRTISIWMVLYPSLTKNPLQFISLSTIHGGEILQRVFFIGLPGHCFVCGRKGHVAATCTRCRISLDQRQQASKQEALHANGGLEDRLVRRRSETEKVRRKEGKKRRRRARKTEAPSLCISEEKMFLLSPRILLLLHHLFMIRHPTLRTQVWILAAVLKT